MIATRATASDEALVVRAGGVDCPCTVTRRGRGRAITIRVDPDLSIHVMASRIHGNGEIHDVLASKAAWLDRRISRYKKILPQAPVVRLEPGGVLPVLGVPRSILPSFDARARTHVTLEDHLVRVETRVGPGETPETATRRALEGWLRGLARARTCDRIAHFQREAGIGIGARKVFIKDQRTRWGSCSSKGNVNVNWRIVMAPPGVFDYVIVHELCHLHDMSHSQAFWARVASVIPGHARCRAWLRDHGWFLRR